MSQSTSESVSSGRASTVAPDGSIHASSHPAAASSGGVGSRRSSAGLPSSQQTSPSPNQAVISAQHHGPQQLSPTGASSTHSHSHHAHGGGGPSLVGSTLPTAAPTPLGVPPSLHQEYSIPQFAEMTSLENLPTLSGLTAASQPQQQYHQHHYVLTPTQQQQQGGGGGGGPVAVLPPTSLAHPHSIMPFQRLTPHSIMSSSSLVYSGHGAGIAAGPQSGSAGGGGGAATRGGVGSSAASISSPGSGYLVPQQQRIIRRHSPGGGGAKSGHQLVTTPPSAPHYYIIGPDGVPYVYQGSSSSSPSSPSPPVSLGGAAAANATGRNALAGSSSLTMASQAATAAHALGVSSQHHHHHQHHVPAAPGSLVWRFPSLIEILHATLFLVTAIVLFFGLHDVGDLWLGMTRPFDQAHRSRSILTAVMPWSWDVRLDRIAQSSPTTQLMEKGWVSTVSLRFDGGSNFRYAVYSFLKLWDHEAMILLVASLSLTIDAILLPVLQALCLWLLSSSNSALDAMSATASPDSSTTTPASTPTTPQAPTAAVAPPPAAAAPKAPPTAPSHGKRPPTPSNGGPAKQPNSAQGASSSVGSTSSASDVASSQSTTSGGSSSDSSAPSDSGAASRRAPSSITAAAQPPTSPRAAAVPSSPSIGRRVLMYWQPTIAIVHAHIGSLTPIMGHIRSAMPSGDASRLVFITVFALLLGFDLSSGVVRYCAASLNRELRLTTQDVLRTVAPSPLMLLSQQRAALDALKKRRAKAATSSSASSSSSSSTTTTKHQFGDSSTSSNPSPRTHPSKHGNETAVMPTDAAVPTTTDDSQVRNAKSTSIPVSPSPSPPPAIHPKMQTIAFSNAAFEDAFETTAVSASSVHIFLGSPSIGTSTLLRRAVRYRRGFYCDLRMARSASDVREAINGCCKPHSFVDNLWSPLRSLVHFVFENPFVQWERGDWLGTLADAFDRLPRNAADAPSSMTAARGLNGGGHQHHAVNPADYLSAQELAALRLPPVFVLDGLRDSASIDTGDLLTIVNRISKTASVILSTSNETTALAMHHLLFDRSRVIDVPLMQTEEAANVFYHQLDYFLTKRFAVPSVHSLAQAASSSEFASGNQDDGNEDQVDAAIEVRATALFVADRCAKSFGGNFAHLKAIERRIEHLTATLDGGPGHVLSYASSSQTKQQTTSDSTTTASRNTVLPSAAAALSSAHELLRSGSLRAALGGQRMTRQQKIALMQILTSAFDDEITATEMTLAAALRVHNSAWSAVELRELHQRIDDLSFLFELVNSTNPFGQFTSERVTSFICQRHNNGQDSDRFHDESAATASSSEGANRAAESGPTPAASSGATTTKGRVIHPLTIPSSSPFEVPWRPTPFDTAGPLRRLRSLLTPVDVVVFCPFSPASSSSSFSSSSEEVNDVPQQSRATHEPNNVNQFRTVKSLRFSTPYMYEVAQRTLKHRAPPLFSAVMFEIARHIGCSGVVHLMNKEPTAGKELSRPLFTAFLKIRALPSEFQFDDWLASAWGSTLDCRGTQLKYGTKAFSNSPSGSNSLWFW